MKTTVIIKKSRHTCLKEYCCFIYSCFDWSIEWLIDWLIDWFIDWLIERFRLNFGYMNKSFSSLHHDLLLSSLLWIKIHYMIKVFGQDLLTIAYYLMAREYNRKRLRFTDYKFTLFKMLQGTKFQNLLIWSSED